MRAMSTRSAKTAAIASRGLRAARRPRTVELDCVADDSAADDNADSMSELTAGNWDGGAGVAEAAGSVPGAAEAGAASVAGAEGAGGAEGEAAMLAMWTWDSRSAGWATGGGAIRPGTVWIRTVGGWVLTGWRIGD